MEQPNPHDQSPQESLPPHILHVERIFVQKALSGIDTVVTMVESIKNEVSFMEMIENEGQNAAAEDPGFELYAEKYTTHLGKVRQQLAHAEHLLEQFKNSRPDNEQSE